MFRYIRTYIQMVGANIAVLASYRVAFINMFLVGIIWGFFLLASAMVLTTKITSIGGWSRVDLILLSAMYNVVMGMFYVFVAPNFHDIPDIMQYGKLDLYLLRPIDAQFLLHWRTINLGGVGRLLLGIIAVGVILSREGIPITVLSVLSTLGICVVSCLFLYSVWANVASLLFWQHRLNNIIDLLYTTTGFGRYPRETLLSAPFFVTLVVTPLFLTVSTPTRMLRGVFHVEDLLILGGATLFLLLTSRVLWKLGLRAYAGASS